MVHHVRENRIKKLLKRAERKEVMFHHRYSTSTVDVRNACHPFSTKDHFDDNYVFVHNGVVQNPQELKAQHEKLGIKYVSTQPNGSFNDSEALMYDVVSYLEGKTDKMTAYGSIAFICIKMVDGKPSTLFFGHNSGNPLVMKKTKNSITVSSEGEGVALPIDTLHMYDYDTQLLRTTPMTIPRYKPYASYSGYTPGYQQPLYSKRVGGATQPLLPSTISSIEQSVDIIKGDRDTIIKKVLERASADYYRASEICLEIEEGTKAAINKMEQKIIKGELKNQETDLEYKLYNRLVDYKNLMNELASDFFLLADDQEDWLREGGGYAQVH